MAGECRKKKIRNDCGATSVGDGVVRFTYGVGEGAACGEEIGSISMDQCENETINIPCPTNSELEIKHCDETYIYDPSDVEDTVIDLGCGRLIDWSNMPVCDDCIVWCGETGPGAGQLYDEKPAFMDLALQQGVVKRKSEPKGFKSKPAAKLPPKPPAKPPQKQGKPDRVYVLKFWSTSCGICGRMAHYDQKVSEEEGATYISVQKLKPDVWARYLYVAKQKFEDPNTQMGFPTYMVCKGPGDLSLEVVDVINGGMDKGKFRAKVKAGIAKAKESFQSEAGTTDSPEPTPAPAKKKTKVFKFSSSDCGTCGRMAKFDQGAVEQLGYEFQSVNRSDTEEWKKYQYVLDQIYGPEDVIGFPSYIAVEGTDETDMVALGEVRGGMDKGKFKEKIQLVIKNRASEPRVEPGDENCKYWKVRCECGCQQGEGESGNNPIWTIKYYEDENLPGSNSDYEIISTHTDVNACKDNKCIQVELGCNCNFPDLNNGDIRDGLCTLTCYKKKDEPEPTPEPEPETCDKDFTLVLDCPKDCGKDSGTRTINATADGIANSNVDFKWYEGSAGGGNQIGSGTSVNINCPAPGQSQKYACQATYKEGPCDITRTENCVVSTDADPCAGVSCGPCQECVNGECVDQCKPGEECVNGNCQPVDPCKDVTCPPCHNCVNGECVDQCGPDQECVGGKCVAKDPCADVSCPPCHRCVNGECVDQCGPDQECVNGKCEGIDPCEGVSCPPCNECIGGECVDQCRPNQECVGGICVDKDPCDGVSCPPCHECVNGECVSLCKPGEKCEGGSCVPGDPCEGVSCPPCHECVNGECVSLCGPGEICDGGTCVPGDPCEGVSCPPCHECVNGECVFLCADGEKCENGQCVPGDPCEGVSCPPCHECVNGECVSLCSPGEKCENGQCVPGDPCEGVSCPPCHNCVNGECVPQCGPGEDCVDGECVNTDPCFGVTCPPCHDCVNGECVSLCADNEECVNGECVNTDPCFDVSCPPCSICVGGECEDSCPPDYECVDGICVRPDPPIQPEEPFECGDCTGWTIDWVCVRKKALEKMGKIVGKNRITVWPSHGDLRLGDVEISATGNTGPGVDIIYDPIFIDFEEQSDGSDYWADRNKEFDYFGSRGIQDDESWIPYMVKDVEKSKLFTLQDIPAEANGAFVEINFRGSHSPSVTHALNHPSYLLDETVETFLEFKNLLAVTGGEFVSGQKDSMHNNLGFHMACKLDPTSVVSDIQTASNRQQKLNFMTFTPGTRITVQTKVYVIHYHYTSAAMGLGRAKITPVRYVDSDAGLRLIRQQVDNFNIETANSGKYFEKPADVVRMQGADLRQAVDQLNSAIDFKLAVGGGNASQIQQLRSDLNSQVLQGSGDFQTIRTRMTALKTTAESLGVIGLTKLERDAGVQWGQPGDPNHPL